MINVLAGLMGLGLPEMALIALLVVVLFGAKKLPELGGSLGKGIQNFKKSMKDGAEEEEKPGTDEDDKQS